MHSALLLEMAAEGLGSRIALGSNFGGVNREAAASDNARVRARLGSVGRPLPTLELAIRNREGKPVPAGTEGEIWVRGGTHPDVEDVAVIGLSDVQWGERIVAVVVNRADTQPAVDACCGAWGLTVSCRTERP